MRKLVPFALVLLAAVSARAQSDSEDPRRMRVELSALKKEVRELKARLARLEEQMASIAQTTSDTTKPEIRPDLGFVFPGAPPTTHGAESPSELARFLHHFATSGEHDLEKLMAFNRGDFLVPEGLWNKGADGLKTVQGLPARDELELALGSLKALGAASQLMGMPPVPDLAPRGSDCVSVLDLVVSADAKNLRYRLTAVKIGGRYYAAHLIDVSAEDDARQLLEDLATSQRTYHALRQRKYYARNLHELAGARAEIEQNPSIKQVGLAFPLGARLDREKDRLEWVENDLRGPFYRFSLTGDEKGWSAEARPRSPSYWTFTVRVPPGADPAARPVIRRSHGSGDEAREPRKDGEPEGD